ncbi:ImmA/IrrE family metallo-endopeptidase [Streptomyces virginiae]|uniref:ImmA/IrrE family metallo-endopeptidase n=1 Tax=Streptomyces virginiae TaxID=1961 RepID=UPI0022580328|nr:ImmA/IrrE family metallo-endopeptidase [Streptomyces virginiae]MCX5176781.1 ImmA/IrrE family metallo-endopeptidase [Streptomyces virginiae]
MSYSPLAVLDDLRIPVVRVHLRDTWGAWSPLHRKIVVATGLSAAQELCVLAHEVEHALADDLGCGVGLDAAHPLATQQERRADIQAARKLIAISDLAAVAQWADDVRIAAAELGVTERMLRVRLHELNGEGWPWPATSRTVG